MQTNIIIETLLVNITLLLERSTSVINGRPPSLSTDDFLYGAQSNLLVEFIYFFPLLSHQHRSRWDNANRF